MASNQQGSSNDNEQVIEFYAAHKKVYSRKSKGRYTNLRILFVLATQLFFFCVPWLNINGRQAFLLDIATRKFYIFGITIWPQDLFYLTGLLICSALGLFWWTSIAGRLWCGYACPQTVYTEIMIWIDRLFEGDRQKQIKLDKAPLSAKKAGIKTAKYITIILFCLWTGFTFIGFFSPIRPLFQDLIHFDLSTAQTFWMLFYGGFTFLLANVLREQVCKYMCPYARFQSAMFDRHTLIISYDKERGEPRGARKKGADYKAENKGECIDCTMCVQVCPVGIDIRNGLQYECIGCALCIDACNEIMDKMNYPRGLVRYTTEAVLEKEYTDKDIAKRLTRPKVLGYGAVLFTILTIILVSLVTRLPFRVDVVKDPSVAYRENRMGMIENTYTLKLMNVSEQPRKFKVSVTGFKKIVLDGMPESVTVPPEQTLSLPVRVATEWEYAPKGKHDIVFEFTEIDQKEPMEIKQKSSFIGASPI